MLGGIVGAMPYSSSKEKGVNANYWRPELILVHGFQFRANAASPDVLFVSTVPIKIIMQMRLSDVY
jgi:hypothetical protein